jgi:2-methylcitrate dehydratase PrpD
MTDHERVAADFASDLSVDDVPGDVLEHVGLVVADTLGAIVGGSTDSSVADLAATAADRAPGDAAILGTDRSATPARAALVNGTAGTVLELDEGHKYAAGHPAIHVLPAVLAEADADGAPTDRFVAALVAGYEIGTRTARACYPLASGYHPHGVWGAVGAAAGVARYRGYDAETTLTAMRFGALHAQQTLMGSALEGATERNTYSGMSNTSGVVAADLAEAGFTAVEDGVERHLERVTADGFDAEQLSRGYGDRWEVTLGYFKRHAACRYTHPTLDAVAAIQERRQVDPSAVESVLVETYRTAAELTPTRPKNSLQAKFSVPFAVATRIVHGHSDKPAFEPEALSGETYALADRVEVDVAPDIDERVPDARSARVTVRFADGATETETVEHARGGEERPWPESDLREKFGTLVEPVVGADAAERLWAGCRNLSAAPAELCSLTRP